MDQNPSLEANGYSDDQEIPRLFSNRNFITAFDNSLPLVPILSQMHPVHTFVHFCFLGCYKESIHSEALYNIL